MSLKCYKTCLKARCTGSGRFTGNYRIEMNASEAVSAFNVTESFSPIADLVAIESFYNTALNIVFVLYIPVMALMITLMWGFTPTAMTTFKFTVSNMVFWIAVALLYVAFFFRPMLVGLGLFQKRSTKYHLTMKNSLGSPY